MSTYECMLHIEIYLDKRQLGMISLHEEITITVLNKKRTKNCCSINFNYSTQKDYIMVIVKDKTVVCINDS